MCWSFHFVSESRQLTVSLFGNMIRKVRSSFDHQRVSDGKIQIAILILRRGPCLAESRWDAEGCPLYPSPWIYWKSKLLNVLCLSKEFWFTPFIWLSINQFTPDISLMFNQLQCVIHSWCAGPKCMVVDFNFKNVCFFFSPKLLVQKMGGGIIWSLPVPRVCSNGVIKWPWVVTTQAHLFVQKPAKHICTRTSDRASISIFIGVDFPYCWDYIFFLENVNILGSKNIA